MFLIAAQSFLPMAALAVIGVAVSGLMILFWLWMAVDCLVHEPESTQKSAWLLAILLGNWIGALFYFFIRRRERLNSSWINPPRMDAVGLGSPRQVTAAGVVDAEIVTPNGGRPSAGSSLARPSDWTYLRILVVILGVLVVLPTAFVVVMYCVMVAMFLSSVRKDNEMMRDDNQAAEQRPAEFQKWAAEQEAAAKKRARMGKIRVEPMGEPVTASTPLSAGDVVFCSWGLEWYQATVLEVQQDGDVKIHWQNWDDFFDEVVSRERLQLPREAGAEK